jgi:type IV secretion system protein VirB10
MPGLLPPAAPVPSAPSAEIAHRAPAANPNLSNGKSYTIFEGTLLEAVLVNRLDGDFNGPVICMMTSDVYSEDRQHLLIPAGSKLIGETKRVDAFGQRRLAVSFHRLIMPDGYSLDLDHFQGLNQIGETGLKDKVNNHYLQIFGASIAIGAIGGLAQLGTQANSAGVPESSTNAYRQGVANSLSQSSLHVLDRFLNILPTVTIREGHRVKVYLTEDLLIPDYTQHVMPSNI